MERYPSKNYKKYTPVLLLTAAAALAICAVCLTLKHNAGLAVQGSPEQASTGYYSPKPGTSQESGLQGEISRTDSEEPRQAVSRPGTSSPVQEAYTVTIYQGKIGVFRDGDPSPLLTADVDLDLLPEQDLSLLKKGIRAGSLSEAKGVLEDYE